MITQTLYDALTQSSYLAAVTHAATEQPRYVRVNRTGANTGASRGSSRNTLHHSLDGRSQIQSAPA